MKALILVLFFTGEFVFASQFISINPGNGIRNPQIRVCQQVGGYFGAYDIAHDNVGFCSLGSATIGANDLVLASQGIMTSSVSAYLGGSTQDIASCAQAGASDQSSSALNGVMCRFNDNSWIGLSTLSMGKNNPMNSRLNSALNQLGF